ncbi:MAG: MerR family transcriptional regulator [Chloroflexi bacterium]|nr:MAG: MerR family transcriptional regulator [Chloroflexota bacterium]
MITLDYRSVYYVSAELGRQVSSHLFTKRALSWGDLLPILGRIYAGRRCHVALAVFRPGGRHIMEAPMATVLKRDTRRDTNISLDKPIYTISVASEILETHPRTLMMYEHLGLVVPKRTSTNRRRFSQRDVMKLQTIQKLTRHHSVNLAGVRYILKLLKLLQEHQLPSPVELRDLDVSQLDV